MHQFRKFLTKEQLFTIPNFMSLFRLVLIPFIIWTYWRKEYTIAGCMLLLSGLTDVLDGVIARKFDMVSDLGKMLDPLCDKLTHAAILICLVTRYHYIWIVFGILVVKELSTVILGSIMVKRRGEVISAKWFGKVCTVTFEAVMMALILFPGIPEQLVIVMLVLCSALLMFSMVMYDILFLRMILHKD